MGGWPLGLAFYAMPRLMWYDTCMRGSGAYIAAALAQRLSAASRLPQDAPTNRRDAVVIESSDEDDDDSSFSED